MNSKFNLQFFGGDSTSTQRYAKRDPEPQELTNLRTGLYEKLAPELSTFDTNSWQNAQNITNQALQ